MNDNRLPEGLSRDQLAAEMRRRAREMEMATRERESCLLVFVAIFSLAALAGSLGGLRWGLGVGGVLALLAALARMVKLGNQLRAAKLPAPEVEKS